jgi:undecaprenyl-diphosphatase
MDRARRPAGAGPVCVPSAAHQTVPLAHALALGLLQGPTELLPISSSAHTTLLARLARSPYAQLDGERRKSFEVALHAGAGLALAIHMRRQLLADATRIDGRRALAIALAIAPPALAGYAFERPIEQRLGGTRSIAVALLGGALAMALADARARGRATSTDARHAGRGPEDLHAADGLALGLAQAAALIPGVSRNGAALTAARARGFDRPASQSLSWHAGLPVLLGASALKGMRLLAPLPVPPKGVRRRSLARGEGGALALGLTGAFASTLASARLLERPTRRGYALWPYAIYRCVIGALALAASARSDHARPI